MTSNRSDLCRDCGLCCNGALFGVVDIEKDEIGVAGKAACPATPEQGLHFTQPCGFFDSEQGCTIYTKRFQACRVYKCTLLDAFEAGRVDEDAARQTIHIARDLLRKAGPGAQTYAERDHLRSTATDILASLAGPDRVAHTKRMLGVVAVDAFLDLKFRNGRAGRKP